MELFSSYIQVLLGLLQHHPFLFSSAIFLGVCSLSFNVNTEPPSLDLFGILVPIVNSSERLCHRLGP